MRLVNVIKERVLTKTNCSDREEGKKYLTICDYEAIIENEEGDVDCIPLPFPDDFNVKDVVRAREDNRWYYKVEYVTEEDFSEYVKNLVPVTGDYLISNVEDVTRLIAETGTPIEKELLETLSKVRENIERIMENEKKRRNVI